MSLGLEGFGIVYKGPFNNYVDKMRGERVKKCLFLSTQGGGQKRQNSFHVVVE